MARRQSRSQKKKTSGLDLCRLWPLCVNMGHSVLTPWLPCSTGGPTKASDRAGKRRLMTTDPPSFIPSLSSFFLHPSYCHCLSVSFQTKRLFRRLQNKTHHPPFTLGLSKAQQTLSWTREKKKEPALSCSFLFFVFFFPSVSFSRAENFSPLIKEGIIANMAHIPPLVLRLCKFERGVHRKTAHCGHWASD